MVLQVALLLLAAPLGAADLISPSFIGGFGGPSGAGDKAIYSSGDQIGAGALSAGTAGLQGGFLAWELNEAASEVDATPSEPVKVTLTTPAGPITVDVPAGSFSSAVTVSLRLPTVIPGTNASSAGTLSAAGVALEVTLSQAVQPLKTATLTISYDPALLPPGTDPATLILARYDPARDLWIPLPSTVDTVNHRVVGLSDHFSLFQIMAALPAGNLSQIKAYPVPFRPPLGHTSVTFANLPASAEIRIYTLSGELLRKLTANASGRASWDGRNGSGGNVGSGVYLVHCKSGGGQKTIKIAIQR